MGDTSFILILDAATNRKNDASPEDFLHVLSTRTIYFVCTCLSFPSREILRATHPLHLQCLQKLCSLHLYWMQLLIGRMKLSQRTFACAFYAHYSVCTCLTFLSREVLRIMLLLHLHCLQKLC